MSRFYKMEVNIQEVQKKNIKKIIEACQEQWEWENIESRKAIKGKLYYIFGVGHDNLYAHTSENEFAENLAKQIKKVDGKCKINVGATCLENLPDSTYTFN